MTALRGLRDLELHPKVGASWEGYAVEEVLKGRRIGVECKRSDAPAMTPSMRTASESLRLDKLIVAYPGDRRYELSGNVEVIPLAQLIVAA